MKISHKNDPNTSFQSIIKVFFLYTDAKEREKSKVSNPEQNLLSPERNNTQQ